MPEKNLNVRKPLEKNVYLISYLAINLSTVGSQSGCKVREEPLDITKCIRLYRGLPLTVW